MRLFDVATWTAVAILVVGSVAVFVWFLRDAGRVLRGGEEDGDGAAGSEGQDT